MKSLSRIFMVLFLSVAMVGVSNAQGSSQESQLEMYKTKLNLTTAQYDAIKKILADAKATRKANETKYASDKNAMMQANKTLRQATDAKVLAQLDEKQKAIYQQLKEEKKAEHMEHKGEGNEANMGAQKIQERTNELTTKLGLSADQTAKAKAIYSEYLPKIQAIRAQYKSDEATMKSKVQPLRKEMNAKIMSILTDAQKAKLKEMKQENKD
jgi:hypothetical protein